jgi:hypothetical protein
MKMTENRPKEGYIIDFISGQEVKATPEEVEAVQVFSKQLVEDYGYPKSHIQTRPQWRVKVRPSDTNKSYPVDIAVFTSDRHTEDNIFIIVECKKKTRRDGKNFRFLPVKFDRILLDAPCSATGAIRKSYDALTKFNLRNIFNNIFVINY